MKVTVNSKISNAIYYVEKRMQALLDNKIFVISISRTHFNASTLTCFAFKVMNKNLVYDILYKPIKLMRYSPERIETEVTAHYGIRHELILKLFKEEK